MTATRTKKKPIVHHKPVIKQYAILEYPPCMAAISSPEAVRYRLHTYQVKDRYRAREDETGMPPLQCGNVATYQIGDDWYCRKHAALIALDMLAVPVEDLP